MAKGTRRILFGLVFFSALAAAALILLSGRLWSIMPRVAATGDELLIAPKTLSFNIEATALLRATSVVNFGAPPAFANYWQFQIVNLVPEGRIVKPGDQLIVFDAQKIRDDLQRFQNELDQATKELDKTRAQIDLEAQELLTRLAAAENNYEKLKLKQSADPAFDVPTEVEKDRLALEQAQSEVAALKDRIAWHKKSSEATYQIIASKRARAEGRVNNIKRGMENFQATADREGVVIYKTKWNGERFQVGENVWSGQSILEIPDLNTIIAEAYIPEVDIGRLKKGQRVEITIDAFPGKSYSGTVKEIGTLVRPKAWDIPNKILEAQIAFDQLDTSIMRPGMSAKVRIETATLSDCLAIPLKALRTTMTGSIVKVRTEEGWREQEVELGDSNGAEVVVVRGLEPGDRIAADFARAK